MFLLYNLSIALSNLFSYLFCFVCWATQQPMGFHHSSLRLQYPLQNSRHIIPVQFFLPFVIRAVWAVNATGEDESRSGCTALLPHCWKETNLDMEPLCTAALLERTDGWISTERTTESLIMHRYSTWPAQRTDRNMHQERQEQNEASGGMEKGWTGRGEDTFLQQEMGTGSLF